MTKDKDIAVREADLFNQPDHLKLLSTLPKWLLLLIGNYPQSWANEMTYLALMEHFEKFGDEAMEEAVSDYISVSSTFPTAADLLSYAREVIATDPMKSLQFSLEKMGYRFVREGTDDGRHYQIFDHQHRDIVHIYH